MTTNDIPQNYIRVWQRRHTITSKPSLNIFSTHTHTPTLRSIKHVTNYIPPLFMFRLENEILQHSYKHFPYTYRVISTRICVTIQNFRNKTSMENNVWNDNNNNMCINVGVGDKTAKKK